MRRFLWPFAIFVVLLLFLGAGLKLNPRAVPSPFIGKPAPVFELAQLHAPTKKVSNRDMLGRVWLLNVWASWCVSCRVEHPALMDLAKQNVVPIVGLNYKDPRDGGASWLMRFGNPYIVSAYDPEGLVGIDYGVYGVPETFVVDKLGIIRMKHDGPLTPEIIRNNILPLITELNGV